MLIYHQKDDTYHCIYRLMSILTVLGKDGIEIPKLKIIDFYVLFPNLISEVQFPRIPGATKIKNMAASLKRNYEKLPDSSRLFSELSLYQNQAINIILAKKIIEADGAMVKPGTYFNHDSVSKVVKEGSVLNNQFLVSAIKTLNQVDLYGQSGLKARTQLMEARYDAI